MKKLVKLDHFIVVGGTSWGRAPDLDEALRNWIDHENPRKDMEVHIRQVNEEAYVDGLGTLYAHPESVNLGTVLVPKELVDKIDEVQEIINDILLPAEDLVDSEKRLEGFDG